MITGEIKNQISQIWNAFWAGGIANPMEVIEQMTYLLFIKRLDELHTAREKKANRLGRDIENPIFPEGINPGSKRERSYDSLRWTKFKNLDANTMYEVVSEEVFPFIKSMGDADSTYSAHMKDARFTIPTPGLLAKVVDMLDAIPMEDRDTKGDLYEFMLGKIATAGQNGQFRTPRHIIKMMVEMTAPQPRDSICDPACGTAGFLVAAAEYLRDHNPEIFSDADAMRRFNRETFNGFDFDSTMLRIGSMNMLLHGIENPDIQNRDSLSQSHAAIEEQFTLILANPPFAGSLDYESCAKDLQMIVKTRKTELLFVALFLRLLKPGGRAAVIVPDGVLFGSSKAHKALRQIIVENQKLDAVISMPSGVFRPYAGVSTAVLLFTKTNSGGTDTVWFYDMKADGLSLDDKRSPLDGEKHENNNIPDIITRWKNRKKEADRKRTDQSFLVPKDEIADNGYDLSVNRYKEIVYDEVEYDPPQKILADLKALEAEIQQGMDELEGMLR
ncbi:class I SAM-dependent DNA methyltransferase [Marispirochaeta sp.]|uniref:type I restriction-modification system subunit M n=1 Tax=Marispirochaeta sp. TaxID=2038653 RepID=UPI0029C702E0|nr:class I SAM-dependent DNA methyltransferase [Marispirochaeta sp.]